MNLDEGHSSSASRGRSRVVDSVSAYRTSNTIGTFARGGFLFIRLWVVVGGVAPALEWLSCEKNRSNGVGI